MKIAILGDTHFGCRNDSPHFNAYFEKFYTEIFFPLLEKHGVWTIVQLGDLFDRRKYINFTTLKHCREYFFDPLKKKKMQLHVLVGNHDVFYRNTNDVNSVQLLLGEYDNVFTYTEPTETAIGGMRFSVLPWINQDNLAATEQLIADTQSQVALAHLELSGFEMQRGMVMDHGMSPTLFDKFDMVLTGHYHHRSHARNIHYVGTPYEMTWADFNDEKGFHLFDTETRELTFISNPLIMFHKIHYDDADKPSTYLSTFDLTQYANSFVKVIVRNKNHPLWFDALIDGLEQVKAVDIQVVDDHFNMNQNTEDDIISDAEDTLSILRKCVDQLDDSVDKKELDSLLRSLYSEALSME